MRFPQTFIDDLKRQADIVRVISDYVSGLKKKGANWMACCPFHQEKTPSFSVSPSKGIFYCFGCGQKGGVINFVMEIERVSFPEAVRIVAGKVGLALPEMVEDKRFEAKRQESDEVIELNSWALEFWEQHLNDGGAEGRAAREYVEGRAITDETRAAFRLGYAPNSWDALGNFLKSKGAGLNQIERSGLVVKKDSGGSYDRFRGRLIFPVLDAQGRPVAFGARAMRPGDEPKYLNSPETAAYTKGRHLFGLNLSRDAIRRKGFAILVEGYLDLIIPYQFGIKNVVASLGTALTQEQVNLLGRFARKIVVNYDGDRAGIKAATRALQIFEPLVKYGFEIKVLELPNNTDPDEFVRLHGVKEYNHLRGSALSYLDFIWNLTLKNFNPRNPEEKIEAIKTVLPFIRPIPDRVLRRDYFEQTMDALRVYDSQLREEFRKSVDGPTGVVEVDLKRQAAFSATMQKMTVAEQRLLELLVSDRDVRASVLPHMVESDFEGLPSEAVFRALKTLDARGEPVAFDTLSELTADDPAASDIVPLVLMYEPDRAEGEAADVFLEEAESCLLALRLMSYDRRIKELAVEKAAAERAGDEDGLARLVMEDLELKRLRTAVQPRADGAAYGRPASS